HKHEFLAEMRFFYPRAEEDENKVQVEGEDEVEEESRAQEYRASAKKPVAR
ncbi:hypothetical protein SARC_17647, partial [Sphaeroforma arctica JP610]